MIMGAYSALQDWNGLVCFDARYSKKRTSTSGFNILADPTAFISNRILAILFRRGDVQKAKNSFAYLYTAKEPALRINYPQAFSKLGLVSQIGSIDATMPTFSLPKNCKAAFGLQKPQNLTVPYFKASKTLANELIQANVVTEGVFDLKNSKFISDTNELFIDGIKNSFKVISPKTEGFAIQGQQKAQGKYVETTVNSTNPALIFVSAMDGKNINESQHLLLVHMTDITNTDLEYKNENSATVTNWGKLPLLLQKGQASVTISFADKLKSEIWALSPGGKRIKQLTARENQGILTLNIATDLCKSGVMAYEIIRKQED